MQLVFKANRIVHHSTAGSSVIKKEKKSAISLDGQKPPNLPLPSEEQLTGPKNHNLIISSQDIRTLDVDWLRENVTVCARPPPFVS